MGVSDSRGEQFLIKGTARSREYGGREFPIKGTERAGYIHMLIVMVWMEGCGGRYTAARAMKGGDAFVLFCFVYF